MIKVSSLPKSDSNLPGRRYIPPAAVMKLLLSSTPKTREGGTRKTSDSALATISSWLLWAQASHTHLAVSSHCFSDNTEFCHPYKRFLQSTLTSFSRREVHRPWSSVARCSRTYDLSRHKHPCAYVHANTHVSAHVLLFDRKGSRLGEECISYMNAWDTEPALWAWSLQMVVGSSVLFLLHPFATFLCILTHKHAAIWCRDFILKLKEIKPKPCLLKNLQHLMLSKSFHTAASWAQKPGSSPWICFVEFNNL